MLLVKSKDVVTHVLFALRDVENINLVSGVMTTADSLKNFVLIALNQVIIQSPREQPSQRIIPYSVRGRVSRQLHILVSDFVFHENYGNFSYSVERIAR